MTFVAGISRIAEQCVDGRAPVGQSVHQGLYVADTAVVPGPVAVNPTLTIAVLAQKIASQTPSPQLSETLGLR
jgi:hypothetical protein